MSKIVLDFNLEDKFEYKKVFKSNKDYNKDNFKSKKEIIKKSNNYSINIKSRKWNKKDILFWNKFGVSIKTLIKYNVYPVDLLFLGNNLHIFKMYKPTYAFKETKDNKISFKIYQPFNLEYKWINNHNDSVWQGWTQLPKKHNFLIITKSLKDVMALYTTTKLPSTSLQAESVEPKQTVINELKSRFKNIFLLYDNDFDSKENWGRKFGKHLSEKFKITQIEIPSEYKSKDYSDLIKNHGVKKAKEILKKLIYENK